jgi:dipeptidase E
VIWEGLGIIDYVIVPHYKSDHPESEIMEEVVEYLIENKIPYKTLRDGEVIIVE